MFDNPNPLSLQSSKQALLDEIDNLREKLAVKGVPINFREELKQNLSEAIKLGFWEWDEIADRPDYLSEELANILGLDPKLRYEQYQCEEDLFKFIHPDDLDHYQGNIGAGLKEESQRGLAHVFEYRVIKPDGEIRHVRELEYGTLVEDGVIKRSYGAIQDITDHYRSLEALKQSEQRYLSLFTQLPFGAEEQDYSAIKKVVDTLKSEGVEDLESYFLSNPQLLKDLVNQGRTINVNDALIKLHGAESAEEYIEAEADVSLWWSENWQAFFASEIAGLASQGIHDAELTDTRVDGTEFVTRLVGNIVKGDEHSWKRVLTLHEDVTDRKNYEANLIEAKAQAEKASKAKTEFLSRMSHELRTPLNAILGYSQLFEFDENLDEQRRSKASAIKDAGKHLLNLIDEILDLSRIEGGYIDLSMEAVSLQSVINDSVAWISDMAKDRSISIDFEPSNFSGVMVEADAIRLRQVFLNLLTNAVKYNREGGRVSVNCAMDRNRVTSVSVTDNGIGISQDRLSELFKPFNRLGAEFSAIEGTGIGLVITKRLVDLMLGELEVVSNPGQGSTFIVRLQAIQVNQCEIDISGSEVYSTDIPIDDSTGGRSHILVAEDNPVNRDLMSAQLELLGYSADYAENGVVALELWKSGNYQLLLTDMRMPEMDGYELIQNIRGLETTDNAAPIIAVTANAMESDVRRCFDVGVSDVISKPFGLEDLRSKLDKWSRNQVEKSTHEANTAQVVDIEPEAVDMSMLKQAVGDKTEIHHRLLTSYINELPNALEGIRQAFGWKNHDQLRESVHKLKSSSGSVGATQLAEICAKLESACRKNRETDINIWVHRLLIAAEAVETFIEDFCVNNVVAPDAKLTPRNVLANRNQLSVLLVDDDYVLHSVTKIILSEMGIHQVLTALSGQQALDILDQRNDEVDILICDLNMPNMDGVEFTRHLAQRKFSGSLALLSGEDLRILKTVEKLAIEHKLQVIATLEKPVTQAKLNQLLDAYNRINSNNTVTVVEEFSPEELLHAIRSGELETYFQPKVDVKTQRVVGAEALVRWRHPTKGIINPNSFIPLAEEQGLISELTMAVCSKALQYVAAWSAQGVELNIALNISIDALNDLSWPDAITAQLEASGLQAAAITLEITESRLMEHISVALEILSRLSLKRFNLSIDDFGTGYSSMEQLQRIPFSELKIDRAFVRGAHQDASARAILESSVLLAKKLDMKVVAEGVETQEDWALVAKLGCDQVQGYYVAKPMPADQFLEWYKTQKPVG